jgi:hypothetical protein
LIRDANTALTARQAATIVKRTAEQVGARQLFGHGIVNAFDGVMQAVDFTETAGTPRDPPSRARSE